MKTGEKRYPLSFDIRTGPLAPTDDGAHIQSSKMDTAILEIVNQINLAILNRRPKEAYAIALQHLRKSVNCQQAGIKLFDFDGNYVQQYDVRFDGRTRLSGGMKFPMELLGNTLEILMQGKVLAIPDVMSYPNPPRMLEMLKQEGIRSLLAVPLIFQDKPIGFINMAKKRAGAFDPENIRLVRGLANHLAVSFQHERLYERLEQYTSDLVCRVMERTEAIQTLYLVAKAVSESGNLIPVIEGILALMIPAVNAEAAAVQIFNESNDGWKLTIQQNVPENLLARMSGEIHGLHEVGCVVDQQKQMADTHMGNDLHDHDPIMESHRYSYLGLPIMVNNRLHGVMSVFRGAGVEFNASDLSMLSAIVDHISIAVANDKLQQFSRQAAAATERERLARELHDSVSQSLYSLSLLLEASLRICDGNNSRQLKEYMSIMAETVHQALKEMRLLIYRRRPSILEREGFLAAMQQRLDLVEKRAGITARFLLDGLSELPRPVEDTFFGIAQEALNNILKHAAATQVYVLLRFEKNGVMMEISDNGLGFDTDHLNDNRGMGLTNMRKRAESINGILDILSETGKGTRVIVKLGDISNEKTLFKEHVS